MIHQMMIKFISLIFAKPNIFLIDYDLFIKNKI
jgi:hypothetical protein